MKRQLNFLFILISIITFSCGTPEVCKQKTVVHVLLDVTTASDFPAILPKSASDIFIDGFGVKKDGNMITWKDDGDFMYVHTGDVHVYPISSDITKEPISINVGEQAADQIPKRAMVNSRLKSAYSDLKQELTGLDQAFEVNHEESEVWRSITHQATLLSQYDDVDRKILIIMTDLLENSSLASFYALENIPHHRKYKEHASYEKMNEDTSLARLDGVEIYLVGQISNDPKEKQLFSKAKKFWVAVLKDQGAKVSYTTKLNIVPPKNEGPCEF